MTRVLELNFEAVAKVKTSLGQKLKPEPKVKPES